MTQTPDITLGGCPDLIALIDRRIALVDSLAAAWERRRAARPIGQQIYRDRAERSHRARMAAATAFQPVQAGESNER